MTLNLFGFFLSCELLFLLGKSLDMTSTIHTLKSEVGKMPDTALRACA